VAAQPRVTLPVRQSSPNHDARAQVAPIAIAGALALAASCSASERPPQHATAPGEETGTSEPPAPAVVTTVTESDVPTKPAPSKPIVVDERTRYRLGPLHSPITAAIAARLADIVSEGGYRKDVFAKIGDSLTVDTAFLNCFSGNDARLFDHATLEPTRSFFRKTVVDGIHSSFDRPTLGAKIGWTAGRAIDGDPSPIEQEIDAVRPSFAIVLLGTNDTLAWRVPTFERDLRRGVDRMLSLGVVPLLTTIPPRADDPDAHALVPEMNAIVRALAQSRQIPLLDLYTALARTPSGHALAPDGIHLEPHISPVEHARHGCWLSEDALRAGTNARNLLTLQALDRMRRFVLDNEAPEADPPPLLGEGTWNAPFVVDGFPFVDDRDTTTTASHEVDRYPCSPKDESGGEVVYTIKLDQPMRLRARVFGDDGVDVDLHWLIGPSPSDCVLRGEQTLDVLANPGTHRLVVDTRGGTSPADTHGVGDHVAAGAYRLTLVRLD